jgi:anti-anti-sigma factor
MRIDLSEVSFMDSTALGALVSIRNAAEPRPVILENPLPLVLRILEITGLDQVFAIEPTVRVRSA